jgi:hypothetical protein
MNDDEFDEAIDDATHAVIDVFERAGLTLPERDDLSDLMVRINDFLTQEMGQYR